MALINCKECGKEISNEAVSCPHCGYPVNKQSDAIVFNVPNDNVQKAKKAKNNISCGTGCLIIGIIGIVFTFCMCSQTNDYVDRAEKVAETGKQGNNEEVIPVFNTQVFIVDNTRTVTEEELVKMLGQPDSVDNWNYTSYKTEYPVKYPIVEYKYGDWYYKFNNGYLHRISNEGRNLSYTSKKDFLSMFGCKEYANTTINDTNFAYVAENCGVRKLWLGYENRKIFG